MSFRLSIFTPNEGKIYEKHVRAVTASARGGSLGILSGHAPLMAVLNPGILKIDGAVEKKQFQVADGFLDVNPLGEVRILSASAKEIPLDRHEPQKE